jgi:hypothetical protein
MKGRRRRRKKEREERKKSTTRENEKHTPTTRTHIRGGVAVVCIRVTCAKKAKRCRKASQVMWVSEFLLVHVMYTVLDAALRAVMSVRLRPVMSVLSPSDVLSGLEVSRPSSHHLDPIRT